MASSDKMEESEIVIVVSQVNTQLDRQQLTKLGAWGANENLRKMHSQPMQLDCSMETLILYDILYQPEARGSS